MAYLPSGGFFHVAIVSHSVLLIHLQNIGDLQRFKSLARLQISCCIQCGIWMYGTHARTFSFIRYDFIFYYKSVWYASDSVLRAFCIAHFLCICADAVAIADDDVGFYFGLESSLEKNHQGFCEFLFILFFFLWYFLK